MIRAGCAADLDNAISLCRVSTDGILAAGIALAGYGTKPIPGAICSDAEERAVKFAANHLHKTITTLMEQNCINLDYAKSLLKQQLEEVNAAICAFGRQIGQGVYLAGVITYVAEQRYICLPFGGGYAYRWELGAARPIRQNHFTEMPDEYIPDALGGCAEVTTLFEEGNLPIGAHLVAMTQCPDPAMITAIMATPAHLDPGHMTKKILRQTIRQDMPLAVFSVSNLPGVPIGGDNA